jgi:hypothetical protein
MAHLTKRELKNLKRKAPLLLRSKRAVRMSRVPKRRPPRRSEA